MQGPVGLGSGYALRVACCLPAYALPAPIVRIIALTAPTTLGLSGRPFHEPFHGRGAADYRSLDRCGRRSPGLDAGVGRCGGSRLTGALGSESEYLRWRTVSGDPRDIRLIGRRDRFGRPGCVDARERSVCVVRLPAREGCSALEVSPARERSAAVETSAAASRSDCRSPGRGWRSVIGGVRSPRSAAGTGVKRSGAARDPGDVTSIPNRMLLCTRRCLRSV